MIDQELRRFEASLRLKVVRDDGLPSSIGVASRRSDVGGQRDDINGARRPSNASAHNKTLVLRHVLQDFGETGLQPLRTQFCSGLKNAAIIARLHRDTAKGAKQGLLPESIREFISHGRCP